MNLYYQIYANTWKKYVSLVLQKPPSNIMFQEQKYGLEMFIQ